MGAGPAACGARWVARALGGAGGPPDRASQSAEPRHKELQTHPDRECQPDGQSAGPRHKDVTKDRQAPTPTLDREHRAHTVSDTTGDRAPTHTPTQSPDTERPPRRALGPDTESAEERRAPIQKQSGLHTLKPRRRHSFQY